MAASLLRRVGSLVLLTTALPTIVACGSASTPTPGASSTASDGGADGGGLTRADGPATYPYGSVSVATNDRSYGGSAGFQKVESTSDCTVTSFGDCKVLTCGAKGASHEIPSSAGPITITGGIMPLTLMPALSLEYPYVSGVGRLYAPGALLHVSSAGNVVPAFETDLTAPEKVLMEPIGTIVRGQPFVFRWKQPTTPTPPGIGNVSISGVWSDGFYCTAPVDAGSVTVSADAIAMIPMGSSSSIIVRVGSSRATRLKVGEWTVDVRVGGEVAVNGAEDSYYQVDVQ